MSSGPYDARANRGLLRLYQMHPSRADEGVIALLLAHALAALPEPDFLQCLYLVAPAHHTDSVKALIELEAALQRAQFPVFWERARAAPAAELLARVPGFDDAVRAFVVAALCRTYQKVEAAVLAAALDIADGVAFASGKGWPVEGSLVGLPPSPDTSRRPKRAEEDLGVGLRVGDMGSLLTTLGRAI